MTSKRKARNECRRCQVQKAERNRKNFTYDRRLKQRAFEIKSKAKLFLNEAHVVFKGQRASWEFQEETQSKGNEKYNAFMLIKGMMLLGVHRNFVWSVLKFSKIPSRRSPNIFHIFFLHTIAQKTIKTQLKVETINFALPALDRRHCWTASGERLQSRELFVFINGGHRATLLLLAINFMVFMKMISTTRHFTRCR